MSTSIREQVAEVIAGFRIDHADFCSATARIWESALAKADRILALLPPVGGEEDRSSRDHAQTIGSSLEDELMNIADELREFSRKNHDDGAAARFWVPPYKLALRIEAALSSAKLVDGDSSRDDHLNTSPPPSGGDSTLQAGEL